MIKYSDIFKLNDNREQRVSIGKLPMGFMGLEFIQSAQPNEHGRIQIACITENVKFYIYFDETELSKIKQPVYPTEVGEYIAPTGTPFRVVGFSQYGHPNCHIDAIYEESKHNCVHVELDNDRIDVFPRTKYPKIYEIF